MANKVILVGNVGQAPKITVFDNGGQVANFSLACSERWKTKDGEKKEHTEWVNVSVFGNLAGIVENFVKKGDKLYLEGKLKTRSYDKDGEKRYVTEVVLQDFGGALEMLSPKGSSDNQSTQAPPPAVTEAEEDDSLPF